ncbi:MAG: class I SAM-dependent methyltransferase [bacterium]|nr:class I SAM-dependent methyltransferase [bacterium]
MTVSMNALAKLVRADADRRSRFHTANGHLCLSPLDMTFALASTVLRHTTGRLLPIPWIALPAYRHLRPLARGATVFEYSSGMSTIWYAHRATRVHAVESNRDWYEKISERVASFPHVQLTHREDEESYVTSIDDTGCEAFDIISIDGSYRFQCFEYALKYLKPGGLMLIDNTDTMNNQRIVDELEVHFTPDRIRRFSGFAPGIFHPIETTICRAPD